MKLAQLCQECIHFTDDFWFVGPEDEVVCVGYADDTRGGNPCQECIGLCRRRVLVVGDHSSSRGGIVLVKRAVIVRVGEYGEDWYVNLGVFLPAGCYCNCEWEGAAAHSAVVVAEGA